jgi:multiple sugar transport system permease protein
MAVATIAKLVPKPMSRGARLGRYTVTYAVLVLGLIVSIFPYLLALFTSLKSPAQLYAAAPWSLPTNPTFANFTQILQSGFGRYLLNTIIVAAIVTVGQLIFSSMAAYAFARLEFPGREALFSLYIATLMVPNIVTLIPLFIIVKDLGLVNTYMGLVLPYVLGQPFGIFLMRQYFLSVPKDIEAAARIDGAGTWAIFFRIMLPLSRPVLATLAIITVVGSWNNFVWPLIITNSESLRTLPVGLAAFQSNFGTQYNVMMAGSVVALLPLILIFTVFQRQIVQSIQLSGGK